jgi:hypothetical protein
MDWNTFNRELQNRVDDPQLRYMLGLIYERLLDVTKNTDANSQILLETVQAFQNMVGLNEIMDGRIKRLHDIVKGRADGVSVESVPITNDD